MQPCGPQPPDDTRRHYKGGEACPDQRRSQTSESHQLAICREPEYERVIAEKDGRQQGRIAGAVVRDAKEATDLSTAALEGIRLHTCVIPFRSQRCSSAIAARLPVHAAGPPVLIKEIWYKSTDRPQGSG